MRAPVVNASARRMVALLALLTAIVGGPAAAAASGQTRSSFMPDADPRSSRSSGLVPARGTEPEILALLDRLFDAMRAGDSTAVRAVFHPQARLMTVATREGHAVVRTESADDFVRAVGTPRREVWDERTRDVEVRTDGELATAWVPYTFHLDDRFSHCGVNAIQLVKGAHGWQVLQLTDTRRPEPC